jgi:hypothetical protein
MRDGLTAWLGMVCIIAASAGLLRSACCTGFTVETSPVTAVPAAGAITPVMMPGICTPGGSAPCGGSGVTVFPFVYMFGLFVSGSLLDCSHVFSAFGGRAIDMVLRGRARGDSGGRGGYLRERALKERAG